MDVQTWFLLQQLDPSQEEKQRVSDVHGKHPAAGSGELLMLNSNIVHDPNLLAQILSESFLQTCFKNLGH